MAMAMAMTMASSSQEPISDPEFVDDFYFSALSNPDEDHQLFPISDCTYASELQFQESLFSSLITPQPTANDDVEPTTTTTTTTDPGQSSTSFCDICADKKEPTEMLRLSPCAHSFCSDCVSSHVTARIVHSNTTIVPCPALDCGGLLDFADVAAVLRPEVAARWDEMLCEALIPASEKFYCPFKDCSAMMVRDEESVEVITESECPVCHRLFCARCRVGWHAGIGCEEFEKLNEDERGREDLMVREMAKSQSWMRCPSCKFYVEKTEGCLHITCRCGFQFCYACGATWSQYHGGCRP